MHLDLETPDLALQTGDVITLDDAAGVRIHATRGTVWVTEEGDINDHIVGPGDVLTIAHCGRTVVQALAPAWISIRDYLARANDPTQTAA